MPLPPSSSTPSPSPSSTPPPASPRPDRIPLPVLTCEGCGKCCYLHAHPPYLPQELDRLPPALRREMEQYAIPLDFEDPGRCVWLTPEGRCKNYEDRPAV